MKKDYPTTDPQDEVFDLVDEKDTIIGSATRREVHADKSLIHRSVSILVYNEKGELYFQKRSATKDTDPSKWTISCSGHVEKGRGYEEAAHRELREELGLILYKGTPCSTARGPLEPVAKYICRAPNETEMMMVYQGFHEGPFHLNTTEISEGTFFTQKELIRLIKKGKIELSFMAEKILEKIGWFREESLDTGMRKE